MHISKTLIAVVSNFGIILLVGVLYLVPTQHLSQLPTFDLFFQNLGFALGAGVLALPFTIFVRNRLPGYANRFVLKGFRVYVLSVFISSIVFIPVRITQLQTASEIEQAGAFIAQPFGAFYGACLAKKHLETSCATVITLNSQQTPSDCVTLIPNRLPEAVRAEMRFMITKPDFIDHSQKELIDRIELRMKSAQNKNEFCQAAYKEISNVYSEKEAGFHRAISNYLLLANP